MSSPAALLFSLALLLSLASGCLEDDAPASDAPADEPPMDEATVTRNGETTLGSVSGSTVTPSRFGFDVVVPAGGASDVHWDLVIDTVPADSVTAYIEGPGCSGSTGIIISVGTSTTISGDCDDLPEGSHAFTAVLDQPAPGFSARVLGQATVVYQVQV